ncbi:hypothetical protein HHK36_013986 [Tetracentron sinense]|uniref:Protein kinase domain-containing protein n=1 Tax=Tetracentron sinense TaxID=13715 RepID=A0A834ZBF7_TETSI|nr:hypothetical protein HHK36_013986 [Tetracentron sinense]
MKKPHKISQSDQELKLFCSFNEAFQPRPYSGKLQYIGGETHIVSVDLSISILHLRSKVLEICPKNRSFSLKYQLSKSEGVDGDIVPLVLISTNDDVRRMIEEYDKLESRGKPGKLWVLVCNDNGYVQYCRFFLLISQFVESPIPCVRAMTTQGDFLSNSYHAKHEVLSKVRYNNVHGVHEATSHHSVTIKSNFHNVNKEQSLVDQQKVVEISGFSIDPSYSSGEEQGYNSSSPLFNLKFRPDLEAGVKEYSNHHNCMDALSTGATSSMDLSLYVLPLSSKEVEHPAFSSVDSSYVSEAFLRCNMLPQPKSLFLMDEVHCSSGPFVAREGVTLNSSSEDSIKLGKDLAHRENNHHTCSKAIGIMHGEILQSFTHLAIQELQQDLIFLYCLQAIQSSDLEDIRQLGSGAYGTVSYGKWKGSDVAIKRIKPSCFTGDELVEKRLINDLWKEAYLLSQLHHPNVLAFYGVVTDGPVTNYASVTEYMVNGSLKQVLRRKDRTIDRRKRLIIAMDAAFGMEYLHKKNIIHFDLKSDNFLVNVRDPHRPVCKIGDLGLSEIKLKTMISGGVRGTIPWMAPELLTSNNMVTEKVDVYSFAIVMWELLTGETPYADLHSEEIIAGIIKGDLRPEVPSWCDPAWRSLMQRCWLSNPDSRPAFSEIVKELHVMAASMNIK